MTLLRAPLGTGAFISNYVHDKITPCTPSLSVLDETLDTRIRFHLRPVTRSVCRVQYAFPLTSPQLSLPLAVRFYELLLAH